MVKYDSVGLIASNGGLTLLHNLPSFCTRKRSGFLNIYIGNENHIGVVYSSYNNSPEVSCSKYEYHLLASCAGRK